MVWKELTEGLAAALRGTGLHTPERMARLELAIPRESAHGDWTTNLALLIAREVGRSPRAVAENIEEALRGQGLRPWHVEGLQGRRWVLLDYVGIVVHVFHEKTREYYLLDRLWGDARSVDLGLEGTD